MADARRTLAAVATVVGLAVGAAGTAGCGGSSSSGNGEVSRTPTQILADAKQATAAAPSLHVSGSVTQGSSTTDVDLSLAHGNGGGTIGQNGASFEIVVAGPSVYLRAGAPTWTKVANAATAQLLAGKWIRTTTSNPNFQGLAGLADVSKLVGSLTPSGAITKQATTTFKGHAAVPLVDSGANKGTLYVAATGQPYVLGVTGGANAGQLVFDRYGSATIPPAPAGALDLSQLQG